MTQSSPLFYLFFAWPGRDSLPLKARWLYLASFCFNMSAVRDARVCGEPAVGMHIGIWNPGDLLFMFLASYVAHFMDYFHL